MIPNERGTNMETIKNVKIAKAVKVSESDNGPSKVVNLTVDFDGADVQDVCKSAMRSEVIRWQASARSNFANLPESLTIKFHAPMGKPLSEAEVKANFENTFEQKPIEEQLAIIKALEEKLNKK